MEQGGYLGSRKDTYQNVIRTMSCSSGNMKPLPSARTVILKVRPAVIGFS